MIEDIKPPSRQPNLNPRSKMRSLRLAGHSQDQARQRITSAQNELPSLAAPINPGSAEVQPVKRRLITKKRLVILVVTLLLTAGALAGWFFFINDRGNPNQTIAPPAPAKKIEPPKPTTVASPLTGMQVPPEVAKRQVTAIMIENSPDSRPQSGLRDAGIIFEAIAEGGITRFATLFLETQPAYVGPVRSLRPYYIDWIQPFDPSVAHVGGSRDALDIIRSPGHKDLDQFFNANSYWRISERYAPHNVYTSFEKLNALNAAKGFNSSTFTPWPRKAESKLPVPTAKTIDFKISGFYYNVHYDYDPATNSYLRSQAGKPHVDVTSQNDPAPRQLNPKVVVALITPYSVFKASDGWRTAYDATGSGPMLVFQDGNVIAGTWSKPDINTQFDFKDSAGKPIKFNAGQTWVSVLSKASDATYAP